MALPLVRFSKEWQRLLLPLSEVFKLHLLSPEAFAMGLEGPWTGGVRKC